MSTSDQRRSVPSADPTDTYRTVQASEEFQELRRRFRAFVWPATIVFLAWYLLYVVLSGWARGFMGTEVLGNINVAYVFGLLQFVSTFLIAWLYSRYANRHLDPETERIAREFHLDQEVPR